MLFIAFSLSGFYLRYIVVAGKFHGQVLVTHDMLGMTQDFNPRFIRRYANLNKEISKACKSYIKDVKENKFPTENESY